MKMQDHSHGTLQRLDSTMYVLPLDMLILDVMCLLQLSDFLSDTCELHVSRESSGREKCIPCNMQVKICSQSLVCARKCQAERG